MNLGLMFNDGYWKHYILQNQWCLPVMFIAWHLHIVLPVIDALHSIFPLQDHGTLRLGGPGHWQVCPRVFQRHFPHHHVRGAAQRGSHPQAVHRHLPGPGDRRAGPGGGNVLQTHLPVPLSRDHDQVDQGENSVKELGRNSREWGRTSRSCSEGSVGPSGCSQERKRPLRLSCRQTLARLVNWLFYASTAEDICWCCTHLKNRASNVASSGWNQQAFILLSTGVGEIVIKSEKKKRLFSSTNVQGCRCHFFCPWCFHRDFKRKWQMTDFLKGFPPTTTKRKEKSFCNWNVGTVGQTELPFSCKLMKIDHSDQRIKKHDLERNFFKRYKSRGDGGHNHTILCLIFFVWDKLNLLSNTCLSQEELFSDSRYCCHAIEYVSEIVADEMNTI